MCGCCSLNSNEKPIRDVFESILEDHKSLLGKLSVLADMLDDMSASKSWNLITKMIT